ncbi:MAG: hypothetical protein E1N59_2096 [Puniceicoccaceae bacterium 5H]|nr:MAG: hypothetical protein E1N59_2096 [Puniceicoccaceae bacterium 5H]
MRKWPIFRRCCLFCWRGSCLTANCLLLILLAIQSVILILLFVSPDIPLPAVLLNRLDQVLVKQQLRAEWDHAYFDLRGRITVQNLRLTHRFDQDQLLSIGTARVSLDWFALREDGGQPLERLMARDIRLYAPNSHDVLAQIDYVDLQHRGEGWELQQAGGNVAGIHVIASGPLPQLPEEEPKADQPVAQRIRDVAARVQGIAEKLPELEGAGVRIQLAEAATEGRPPDASLRGYAHRLNLPQFSLQAQDLVFSAQGQVDPEHPWRSLELQAERLTAEARTAEHLELQAHPWQGGLATGTLRIASLTPKEDVTLRHVRLDWEAPSLEDEAPQWHVRDLSANVLGGLLTVNGTVDQAHQTGDFYVFTEVNPNRILEMEGAQEQIRFGAPSRVEAHVRLNEGFELGPINLELYLNAVTVKGVSFDWGTADGRIENDWLYLDNILAITGGDAGHQQYARGSFHQSLTSRDFYLHFEGYAYPTLLNPMFGDWYDNLWAGLEIPGAPPWSSISVRSQWKLHYAAHHHLAMDMRHVVYRGAPLEKVDLSIRQESDRIQLVYLDARAEQGALTGQVSWQLDPNDPLYRIQRVNLRSTLPVEGLEAALKLEPGTIGQRLETTAPPRVAFAGSIRTQRETEDKSFDLDFSFSNDKPFTLLKLPFDWMVTEGTFKDRHVTLDPLSASVFGGRLAATVSADLPEEGAPAFHTDLGLREASYTRTLQWAHSLTDEEPSQENQPDTPSSEPAHEKPPGELTLDLSLQGTGADLATYGGKGQLLIQDAELQRVRLLGGLSRLLEEVGITFTTFPLRDVDGALELQQGVLHLPDMCIGGPGLKIKVDGDVDLPTKELDLDVRTSPGIARGTILGNMLTGLLTPLGGVLEMEVTGNLEDPQWGWKWNPFSSGNGAPEAQATEENPPNGPTGGAPSHHDVTSP